MTTLEILKGKVPQLIETILGRKFLIGGGTVAALWTAMPADIPNWMKAAGTVALAGWQMWLLSWEKINGVKNEQTDPANTDLAK